MGADVTSNSWGGGGYSSGFNTALNQAEASGQLFVAAAGNSGTDNDASASYPSGCLPSHGPHLVIVAFLNHPKKKKPQTSTFAANVCQHIPSGISLFCFRQKCRDLFLSGKKCLA